MVHPDDDSFRARLRALRQAKGHTQEQLAHLAGLTARAIGKLESGESKGPHAQSLRRLAIVLGVSVDYLLGAAPSSHYPTEGV